LTNPQYNDTLSQTIKENIMDKFTKEQQSVILELARVALADADIYDKVAEELDLSDCYLKGLQIMIEAVSEGIDVE